MWVLNPADWSRVSRSKPITPHSATVSSNRTRTSPLEIISSDMHTSPALDHRSNISTRQRAFNAGDARGSAQNGHGLAHIDPSGSRCYDGPPHPAGTTEVIAKQ